MTRVLLVLGLLVLGAASAHAWLIQSSGGSAPPSCNAVITGSGADGNAILTGSATALGNLTCQ
jgi:hypothetical protein